jgi:hypothetical protein
MGSYAGSSDWDDVPSESSFEAFRPRPVEAASPPVIDAELDLPVPTGPGRRLNVILAFDTTGSMTQWVENVRDKMEYLAVGLTRLLDVEVEVIGVGDHSDGSGLLQIHPFTRDVDALRTSLHTMRATDGGDTPEAFECLFKVLNTVDYPVPTVLVLVTDSIPHDMDGWTGDDDGCPYAIDWKTELDGLRAKLRKVWLVSCATDAKIVALQREMVGANGLVRLDDMRRLVNLVMAMCMDEVGELDVFMGMLERQRGPERRREVLALLGRA